MMTGIWSDSALLIVSCCGGRDNIQEISCCATRLRLQLKDVTLFKEHDIQKIPGVAGILFRQGQPQIVIGLDAAQYYDELKKEL